MLPARGRSLVASYAAASRVAPAQPLRSLATHLPFRRVQRFRSRRAAQGALPLLLDRSYHASIASLWPASSSSSPPPAKGPGQGQGQKQEGSKDAAAAAGKQKEQQSQQQQQKSPSPATVRVTDKRSGSEVRQAEITAREAEKQQQSQSIKRVSEQQQAQAQAQSQAQNQDQGTAAQGTSATSAGASQPRETVSGTIKPKSQQQQQPAAGPSSSSSASTSQAPPSSTQQSSASAGPSSSSAPPPSSPSSSELLKQRLQQAQERLERPMPAHGLGIAGGGASVNFDSEGHIIHQAAPSSPPPPQSSTGSGSSNGSSAYTSTGASGSGGGSTARPSGGDSSGDAHHGPLLPATSVPSMDSTEFRPPSPALDHLFDTRLFVKRLEEAGFLNAERLHEATTELRGNDREGQERQREVLRWITGAQNRNALGAREPAEEDTDDGPSPSAAGTELSTQPLHRPHDPAEAIMQLTTASIQGKAAHSLEVLLNRVQVENQRYLFTAALSELRTELQVRARNDAAALRSITTLLQREVDSLSQRMREDIERMKHDIQVDMNNRKGEAKEEQNSLDQEIQDLNNRFTISLSDLKTEIEQSIKWDLTRRALALVFGLASIVVVTLLAADALTRRAERMRAEEAAAAGENLGNGGAYSSGSSSSGSGNGSGTTGGLIKRRNKASNNAASPGYSAGRPAGANGGVAGGSSGTNAGLAPAPQPALSLRPAEELGLVEQYDQQEERFV